MCAARLTLAAGAGAVQPVEAGGRRQRGRHKRGVDIDAGEVDGPPAGGAFEFFAGGQGGVRPLRLVPAMAQYSPAARRGAGETGDGVEQFPGGADTTELQRVQGDARLGEMDVGIDETGCQQGAVRGQ